MMASAKRVMRILEREFPVVYVCISSCIIPTFRTTFRKLSALELNLPNGIRGIHGCSECSCKRECP